MGLKDQVNSNPPEYLEAAPPYVPPKLYVVGDSKLVSPLVLEQELRAHLRLLRAFKELRTIVEEGVIQKWPEIVRALAPELRWAWFVGLAVDRFESWVKVVRSASLETWIEEELPPLDVLMVWHAYLLNPTWYAEDCTRLLILKQLGNLKDILLKAIVIAGDIETFEPSAAQTETWLQRMGTPFDPIEAASTMNCRTVTCPQCLRVVDVPYISEKGTGYLQSKFSANCPHCAFQIDRDKLALLKFAQDMALAPNDFSHRKEYGTGVYMAGSLRTAKDATDTKRAETVKAQLQAIFPRPQLTPPATRNYWIQSIISQANYSMANVAKRFPKAKRIRSAYTDDRPFSIDLVGAVIRQCSFIDKIYHFGWTVPGAFDKAEDEVVLVHCIARYHAFLDLMSSSPGSLLVPTLDIDLAWHTHQLKGDNYQVDCMRHVGRYVDHDDKVEENHLATSFDATCRAWAERFQVPYTYCGCPLPGTTISQRLKSFVQRRTSLSQPSVPPTWLIPPNRDDALGATHASEHSRVVVSVQMRSSTNPDQAATRRKLEEKIERRIARDALAASTGKLDGDVLLRQKDHAVAFLYPVPFIAAPLAGCISSGGSVVSGGGGCAVGAGAYSAGSWGGGPAGCSSGSSARGVIGYDQIITCVTGHCAGGGSGCQSSDGGCMAI